MFNTFFVNPLYNGFVALLDVIPNADAGVGIVLFTVIVSLVLYPLSKKSLVTQAKTKQFEGELKELKTRYANNKEEQARAMMAFYKEKGINPLSGLFLAFVQLPIIIALYFVFARAGLPNIDASRLYDFVRAPEFVSMLFLGFVDISKKNLILAFVAALAQFIQGWYSPALSSLPQKSLSDIHKKPSFEDSFAAGMRLQVRYFLPGIIFLISYQYSGVIALYFATRSLFMFVQELIMRKGWQFGLKSNGTGGNQTNN